MNGTRRMHRGQLLALLAWMMVTACGGGGGTSAPPASNPGGGSGGSGSGGGTGGGGGGTPPPPAGAPEIGGCAVFPADAIFNTAIDTLPVHPDNAAWMSLITQAGARTVPLHPDWGNQDNSAQYDTYYGIPYNVVGAGAQSSDWPTVSFSVTDPRAGNGDGVPDESDCAVTNTAGGFDLVRNCASVAPAARRFPYPADAGLKAEGGNCNDAQVCGDRHVLVVEQGSCRLWESYFSYKLNGQWYAYSTAAWDLRSNAMRPDTWTSGDAAGLPILPLLARAGEASAGEIRHAFRVTLRDSVLARVATWPARHAAGGATAGGIPFGAAMRLRRDFAIPPDWTPQAQRIAAAMQTYGLYVADIGSDLFVQGEPNAQWDALTIEQLKQLRVAQFEFVDLRPITTHPQFSADSFRASW
ncbi:hypothetical protein GCM10025771_02330 [Niveibacterium umoris]|uniref:Uncharacterized protein n=1 Tax=Niveibacterium umoris TaxID=1193620 RepID=A0A840BNR0_9RHOO|nr:hypothetical protein [Niveibacterium umoris]MBB4014224.1 hypothetical protein [Niveibacterium umoris]